MAENAQDRPSGATRPSVDPSPTGETPSREIAAERPDHTEGTAVLTDEERAEEVARFIAWAGPDSWAGRLVADLTARAALPDTTDTEPCGECEDGCVHGTTTPCPRCRGRLVVARRTTDTGVREAALQRRLYEGEKRAGWDPDNANTFAEEIAHLHEEVAEAFRAYRVTKGVDLTADENGKPQGVPAELADVAIGLFYMAERWGFDLLDAIETKHRYNLTRSYAAEGRRLHEPTALAAVPGASDTQRAVDALAAVTEYAVRYDSGYVLEFPHPTLALSAAVNRVRHEGEGEVVTRRRTVYPDDLTPWTATREAQEGGGDGEV